MWTENPYVALTQSFFNRALRGNEIWKAKRAFQFQRPLFSPARRLLNQSASALQNYAFARKGV